MHQVFSEINSTFMNGEKTKALLKALEVQRVKKADLARHLEISPQALNSMLKRNDGVTEQYAIKAGNLLKINPSKIATMGPVAKEILSTANSSKEALKILMEGITFSHVKESKTERIAELDTSTSLLRDSDEAITCYHDIPKSVLYSSGLKAENVRVIRCTGDSMESQLSDGDLVLVDLDVGPNFTNGVCVLSTSEGLKIKRINTKMDGSVEVISDNKEKYPAETYTKQQALEFFSIQAKVVMKIYTKIL